MFDTVRKNQKLMQLILMLFIVPSFAFFGISSYSDFMDKETDLVKINGKPITAQEVDNAAKRQAERVGGNPQIAQSLPFKQAILNELLQQRILGFAVADLRLQVGKDALIKNLQNRAQNSKYKWKSDMKIKVWNGLVRNADENDIEILSSLLHKYRIFHGGKGQVEDARRFLLERIRNNQ